ncbi:MAG: hypothetical protein ABI629_18860 [bacterium]
MRCVRVLTMIGLAMLLAAPGRAATLPTDLGLPDDAEPNGKSIVAYDFAVGRFAIADGSVVDKRGHYWAVASIRHAGFDDAEQALAYFRPSLEAAGWTFVAGSGEAATFTRPHDGTEQWLTLVPRAKPTSSSLYLVEMSPQRLRVTLPTPSSRPERPALDEDLPYLPPLPAARGAAAVAEGAGMNISRAGSDGGPPQVVAKVDAVREYLAPTRAAVQTSAVYGAALKTSGWQVREEHCTDDQVRCRLLAHWTRDGRDLWLVIDATPGAYRVLSAEQD